LTQIKAFIDDETLSEETRAAIQQTRESRVVESIVTTQQASISMIKQDALRQQLLVEKGTVELTKQKAELKELERATIYRDEMETVTASAEELRAWLGKSRLLHHKESILATTGEYANPASVSILQSTK
jgi:hypothetical protein